MMFVVQQIKLAILKRTGIASQVYILLAVQRPTCRANSGDQDVNLQTNAGQPAEAASACTTSIT